MPVHVFELVMGMMLSWLNNRDSNVNEEELGHMTV